MRSPLIIYLDQNYISNMTKTRLNLLHNSSDKAFWTSLFNDLQGSVIANKLACPSSEFHQEESSIDRRIELELNKTIAQLSFGLELKPWDEILHTQIEYAACTFLNKEGATTGGLGDSI